MDRSSTNAGIVPQGIGTGVVSSAYDHRTEPCNQTSPIVGQKRGVDQLDDTPDPSSEQYTTFWNNALAPKPVTKKKKPGNITTTPSKAIPLKEATEKVETSVSPLTSKDALPSASLKPDASGKQDKDKLNGEQVVPSSSKEILPKKAKANQGKISKAMGGPVLSAIRKFVGTEEAAAASVEPDQAVEINGQKIAFKLITFEMVTAVIKQKESEIHQANRKIDELSCEMADLVRRIQEQTQELRRNGDLAREQVHKANTELQELKAKNTEYASQLDDGKKIDKTRVHLINRLLDDIKQLNTQEGEELVALRRQVLEKELELADANKKIAKHEIAQEALSKLKEEIAAEKAEITSLTAVLDLAKSKKKEEHAALTALMEKLTDDSNEIARLQEDVKQKDAELGKIREEVGRLAAATEELTLLRGQLEQKNFALNALKGRVQSLTKDTKEVHQLRTEIRAKQAEIGTLSAELASLRNQLLATQTALADALQSQKQSDAQNQRLESQVAELEQHIGENDSKERDSQAFAVERESKDKIISSHRTIFDHQHSLIQKLSAQLAEHDKKSSVASTVLEGDSKEQSGICDSRAALERHYTELLLDILQVLEAQFLAQWRVINKSRDQLFTLAGTPTTENYKKALQEMARQQKVYEEHVQALRSEIADLVIRYPVLAKKLIEEEEKEKATKEAEEIHQAALAKYQELQNELEVTRKELNEALANNEKLKQVSQHLPECEFCASPEALLYRVDEIKCQHCKAISSLVEQALQEHEKLAEQNMSDLQKKHALELEKLRVEVTSEYEGALRKLTSKNPFRVRIKFPDPDEGLHEELAELKEKNSELVFRNTSLEEMLKTSEIEKEEAMWELKVLKEAFDRLMRGESADDEDLQAIETEYEMLKTENEVLEKQANEAETRELHTPGLKGSKGKKKLLAEDSEEEVEEIEDTAALMERLKMMGLEAA